MSRGALIHRALASALRQPLASKIGTRAMTLDGLDSFKNAERAAEALFFNKEEEKLLRNLLVKMKVWTPFNAPATDPHHVLRKKQARSPQTYTCREHVQGSHAASRPVQQVPRRFHTGIACPTCPSPFITARAGN